MASAAAVPSSTGATAAGRVRGRAPATHCAGVAIGGSDALEEVGVVVRAAGRARLAGALLLLALALAATVVGLPPLLLGEVLPTVARSGRPATSQATGPTTGKSRMRRSHGIFGRLRTSTSSVWRQSMRQ